MAQKVEHSIRAAVELDEAVNFGDLPNSIQVINYSWRVKPDSFISTVCCEP